MSTASPNAGVRSPGISGRDVGERTLADQHVTMNAEHHRGDERAAADAHVRLREALADQALGDDDREDHDGDDAAGVEQQLHGGEELGVELQEDAGGAGQRERQPEPANIATI